MQIDQIAIEVACRCGVKHAVFTVTPEDFQKSCMDAHYRFVSIEGSVLTLKEVLESCTSCPEQSLE
jgi:hypothetical protein